MVDGTQRPDGAGASRIGATRKLEEEVNEELERLGKSIRWIWSLFILSTVPVIFNGFHVSSYVFLARVPDYNWCAIPNLIAANWTRSQVTSIANPTNPCCIYAYDYNLLQSKSYAAAVEYTRQIPHPAEVSCLSHASARMMYAKDGDSIVSEWNLVCENSVQRSIVQSMLGVGQCVGALGVGILADKYGRKKLFGCGSVLYLVASLVTTYAPWYWAFLIGYTLLGLACSAVVYPAMIIMAENVAPNHRYWTGVTHNIGYPIGIVYLALIANALDNWRSLQLAMTIPALALFVCWYLFTESPRWLLSKGRMEKAYDVVFGRKYQRKDVSSNVLNANSESMLIESTESGGVFKEIVSLYSTSKLRRVALVCHFAYFACSFSYHVTIINADNLSTDIAVFAMASAGVDTLAICVNLTLTRHLGRRWSCMIAFVMAGLCMLALLALDYRSNWVLTIALIGRLGISSVFDTIILYTAELFPTEIRSSAVGVSAMFGHIGSILAPFVVDIMGGWAWYLPTTISGCTLFLSGILILCNPETHDQQLDDHVQSAKKPNTSLELSSPL